MEDPLLLYSVNTWLAYAISERYFKGVHYVWCSPFFHPENGVSSMAMPPTAVPSLICRSLLGEVEAGDRHSAGIKQNKAGLIRGAAAKEKDGVIGPNQEREIAGILEKAETRDFSPLIYVIPFQRVHDLVVEVPPGDRAHPMSLEYRIERLPRASFDIIDPKAIL